MNGTEQKLSSRDLPQQTNTSTHYWVSMPKPENHLFEVTLHIENYPGLVVDLKMPVWTPGSYLVREYAKNLQDFTAFAGSKPLGWKKVSKNHWQVEKGKANQVVVRYRIFAHELSVRTNYLDSTHGYFNGAGMFLRIPGWEQNPIYITVVTPNPQWQVTTALPLVNQEANTFLADNFDTLIDSPFEIGNHQLYHFQVWDKPHELAIWGKGNYQIKQILDDLQKIIICEAQIFGELPYERYVFILHLSHDLYGGLEHKNSCSLIYDRLGFRSKEKYERFMQLLAHEFFHLWNVKRIRPRELQSFDYDQENYTHSLWFCEGITCYYDLLIPFQAGIYDARSYFHHLSQQITRYLTTPGRYVQPLSESSFDAWIKLYRPSPNSRNSQISYYLKGEMVALLLDLLIRDRHQNRVSLNHVMVQMWQKFGIQETGYTTQDLKRVIEQVAQIDLSDFFKQYIDGLDHLPFLKYLEPFGLTLVEHSESAPYLGIRVEPENGQETIKFVESQSPASTAGLDVGDELLAIDGIKVGINQLGHRLQDYQPKDTIEITVFHQDELRNHKVTLGKPRPHKYQLRPVENPSTSQKDNFLGWLGVPITTTQ